MCVLLRVMLLLVLLFVQWGGSGGLDESMLLCTCVKTI